MTTHNRKSGYSKLRTQYCRSRGSSLESLFVAPLPALNEATKAKLLLVLLALCWGLAWPIQKSR